MVAYTYAMPSGIPGNVTRVSSYPNIEAQMLDQTSPPLLFGVPVKMVSGKLQPINLSTDLSSSIYGLLVRPYPTSGNGTDGLGAAVPNKAFPADVMVTGYMNVKVNGTVAPLKDGNVYVRVANPSTGKVVGGIEAAADVTVAGGVITGTGTGTIAATVGNAAKIVPGTYSLVLQTTSNTSKVTVIDPNGFRLADATVGTAYSQEGLNFTITAAGTMTAGDSFSPVVTANTIVMNNSYFTGGMDSSGNSEICFNV